MTHHRSVCLRLPARVLSDDQIASIAAWIDGRVSSITV